MEKKVLSVTLDLDGSEFLRKLKIIESEVDRVTGKIKKLKEETDVVKLTPQVNMSTTLAQGLTVNDVVDEITKRLAEAVKNIDVNLYT